MSTMFRILAVAIVALLVGGCSGGAPVKAGAVSGPAVPPPPSEYIIGPGDMLCVIVLRNPELNAEVPVRPDGKISMSLANDVIAVGKTPTQLSHEIEAVLSEFVRAPTVSVIVATPTSRFSQVKVVGQAVAPRAVPYRNGMTVLDLVIEVGGLSQFAAGNRAKIIRTEGNKTNEIRVRLNDLLNKGRVEQNVALQPGDILVIPETLF